MRFTQFIDFIQLSSWITGVNELVRGLELNLLPKDQKYKRLVLMIATHFGKLFTKLWWTICKFSSNSKTTFAFFIKDIEKKKTYFGFQTFENKTANIHRPNGQLLYSRSKPWIFLRCMIKSMILNWSFCHFENVNLGWHSSTRIFTIK